MAPRLRLVVLAALAIVLFASRPAHAHAVGLSRGTYIVEDGEVRADLTFARADVASLVPALDQGRHGIITQADLERERAALTRSVLGGVVVEADGSACAPHLVAVALTEQDGLDLRARYDCPRGARSVRVTLALLASLSGGHRHLVHATGAAPVDDVCLVGHDAFDVGVPGGGASARGSGSGGATDAPAPRGGPAWTQFLWMGVEHILTGYDHLVFLLGLVLVGGRLRAILAVITAFTLAHSITLAVATLGIWSPSPTLVEPAIALSIAYVGGENFFVESAEGRWRITFPFGLVHGFGFAGALKEIGLPRAQIPEALVLFNVGVEAGQLAVLALLLPVIYRLRREAWFRERAVKALSGAIVLAGIVWFVARLRG